MQDSENPPPLHHHHHHHHHPTPTVNGGPTSLKRPTKQPQTPWFVPPNHVALRLLCNMSRVGGLIGKSGSIIRQLQKETSAKIRVEDLPTPNSVGPTTQVDIHRVILIIGSISISKKITLTKNQEKGDSFNDVGEVEVSAAQEAVVRVFERVIEVAAESDGGGGGGGGWGGGGVEVEGGIVSCRLLVEKGQVGTLIGKGGKNIEMIKREAGCRVKVLNKERLPACAMPNDEMVEIEGDIIAVKKALIAVSRCLQDSPVNKGRIGGGRPYEQVQQEASFDPRMDLPLHRSSVAQPMPTSSNGFSSGDQSMFVERERAAHPDLRASIREVVFNILCPNDRVGGVIGKGGSIVKNLEVETGTAISVGPTVPESAERLITISAMENPESRYSSAQSAVGILFSRFLTASVDKNPDSSSKGPPVSARLVVQANDVGCLLGKGGTIISEMRKLSGAGLRIIGGDQVPKCAIGNVEVVQITGSFGSVQNALYSVTSRLRENILPSKMSNASGSRTGSSFLHGNNPKPYGGGRGPASVERHQSADFSHESREHGALVNNMDHLSLGQSTDRPPSPASWTTQTIPGANQRSNGDIKRGLTNIKGVMEIGSGTRSAFVTNTTVEIVVPDNVIDSVYGENGSNLSRLRQISGAKVIVHDQEPGSTDRTVVISGSPEQTQAAQSLLQAFILQDLDDN